MSLNKVMVIGHLGQDPEVRYTPAGLPVVNLSVATDEGYVDKEGKRQDRVEWHRVVVVGKLALTCHEYLKKGRQNLCRRPTAHARVGEQRNDRPAHRDRGQPSAVLGSPTERRQNGGAFGRRRPDLGV